MPKRRPPATGFSDVVASMTSPEGEEPAEYSDDVTGLSPAGSGELLDGKGCRWTRRRGPLDTRLARRLVRTADEMIVGEGAGEVLRSVPAGEREAEWTGLKDRLDSAGPGSYQAHEFSAPDGRTLLYVEEFC
ncbi:hypothetical protein ACIF8T_16200 [Streptomyces sp. NPDC085946]|uniref:hypothetical protein n=1 Tax=Streptomyces sp. NPDC085946 TaxID=3365744 RepID=UPI0037D4C4CC